VLTRPIVVLRPVKPHQDAGSRTEPPVSVPIAQGAKPAATATPEPLLDPPGVRATVGSHGFHGVPLCWLVPQPPIANSTVWVFPIAINAAQRRDRDAAPPQDRKDPPLAQRVMRSAATVERLPKPGDVARIFSHQQRRELLVDHRRQALVRRHAADLGLGLALAGQAAFGANAHKGRIERDRLPEIAQMLFLGRDRDVRPVRLHRLDLHNRTLLFPGGY